MSKPAANEKDKDAAKAKPSLVARLRNLPQWVREHRIKAAVAFSIIFSIFGASLFTWAVFEAKRQLAEKEAGYTITDALAALDHGDLPEALHIAKLVQQYNNVTTDDAGGPAFIFGVHALQRAQDQYDINAHHSYGIAAHWFEEAHRRGVPEDRKGEMLLLGSRCMVLAERYGDALPLLREALALNPDDAAEINRHMAVAYFFQPDPDLNAALAASDRLLADKNVKPADRADGLLLRAEILLRLGRATDAQHDLDAIPTDPKREADVLVLRARMLIGEAVSMGDPARPDDPPSPEAEKRVARALELLAKAQEVDNGVTAATSRASYVAGLAELARRDTDAAAEQFHQAYRRAVDGPEGTAAQMQTAHLTRLRDKNDAAVSMYGQVLEELGDLHSYRNRWLPLSALKQQLVSAYDDFFGRRQYASAATLAELFTKLFEEDYAINLAADAHVAWASQLAQAQPSAFKTLDELTEESRAHYKIAGKLHERLAEIRYATRDYSEDIWASAQNYLRGADYDAASRQFRKYVEVEPRGHHAEALVGLAEVLLVSEKHDQALSLLKQCLDLYPRDPAIYRARLLLAQLYSELNQYEPAEKALAANLESEALTPVSEEWRRSLFTLGKLLYDVGRYRDAADRLDEAVERYPDDADTIEARYRSAESHRRVAQSIEAEIPTDALPTERAKYLRRAEEEYLTSLARFDESIRIARTPNLRGIDDAGRTALLRNALFARGSILYAVGKLDEAVRAHQTAIASFPNSPAALDAYLQIVDCYRRMQRGPEARGTLEQAKLMLNRLPEDAAFESVSNYSRNEWVKLLDTLGSL